jgi:formylmethanofuran dehydrogenase subunit E
MGDMLTPRVLKQAAAFHGHLGPWLVLGLKAGAYARRKFAASPFELRARVFCPAGTPYTCFLDGVQFSSGCTMGKGNISHARAAGCRVEFTCQGKPGRIRLALRPEVWTELHSRPSRGMAGAARLGREFAGRRLTELFTVEGRGRKGGREKGRKGEREKGSE